MKRLGFAVAVVLAVTAFATTAGAGLNGQMQATPDPATTDDAVTISNEAGDANTCEGGFVNLFVENGDFETVFDDVVEPDVDGNWEQDLGTLPAGDYLAEADCDQLVQPGLAPQRQPFFPYDDIEFTVTQAEPTTTSTAAPTTSGSTPPAAQAATAPRFTG